MFRRELSSVSLLYFTLMNPSHVWKRSYINELHNLSASYGVNATSTLQLNHKLGFPQMCIPIRFKKLVLRNQRRNEVLIKIVTRMRIIGNLNRSCEARLSSNFKP